jgi:hypothetical protein
VKNQIHSLDSRCHGRGVNKIGFDDLDAPANLGQILCTTGAEIVQHPNLVASPYERVH